MHADAHGANLEAVHVPVAEQHAWHERMQLHARDGGRLRVGHQVDDVVPPHARLVVASRAYELPVGPDQDLLIQLFVEASVVGRAGHDVVHVEPLLSHLADHRAQVLVWTHNPYLDRVELDG